MLVPAGFLSTLLLTASVASAAGHGPSSAKRANSHKDKAAALRRAGTAAHERSLPDLAPGHHAVAKKRGEKRCKVRNAPVSAAMAPNSSVQPVDSMPKSSAAAAEPSPSPSSSAWQEPAPTPTSVVLNLAVQPTPTTKWVAPTTSSKAEWVAPTTSSAVPVASAKPNAEGVVSGVVGSLLSLTDGRCGWSGATAHSSNEGGPNGAQSWLNCGLGNGGAWTPPYITLDEVVYVDLATNLASGNSPFSACAPYVDQMYAIGAELNIPPILIASIAMQESTCNPSVTGGGGEQGMFQITPDKCGGAPGGNCKDVHFNMRTGMQYLRDTISQNGGDFLKSLGMYNGWQPERMTMESATAARYTSCCRCQNNLDYLHQTLNGWLQGMNGYSIGTYWNLKTC